MKVRVKVKTLKEYLELRKKSVQFYFKNTRLQIGHLGIVRYDEDEILDVIEGIEKGKWEYEKELEPLTFLEMVEELEGGDILFRKYGVAGYCPDTDLTESSSIRAVKQASLCDDYYRAKDVEGGIK